MSFINNARRAFDSRSYEDEYYESENEYDEEYEDEYDDEQPRRSFFSMFSRKKDKYEDDYAEDESYENSKAGSGNKYSSFNYRASESYDRQKTSSAKYNPKTLEGVEITVLRPMSFDNSAEIVKEVKSGKITIFDVSSIESNDEARRIVDYICGAAEGMECKFERICPSIFCMAPKGVNINNKKSRYR